jgi:alkanesulfonate monooxygenase SsuD/methylene tetrahydromethanopterin reductase-like flavin-dependent oxidoreductase (luciferase family)
MQPDTEWTIVEPGVIALPTTQFVIRYADGYFTLHHSETKYRGFYGSLEEAKQAANRKMLDLISIGIEP